MALTALAAQANYTMASYLQWQARAGAVVVPTALVLSRSEILLHGFCLRHCEIVKFRVWEHERRRLRALMEAEHATFEQEEEFVGNKGTHRKRFRQRVPRL